MSCPIGLSKSCSRFVGNQLAPSAINSSICCCNGVFGGTVITMIVLLAIGMGLAACSFTHFIGSKKEQKGALRDRKKLPCQRQRLTKHRPSSWPVATPSSTSPHCSTPSNLTP